MKAIAVFRSTKAAAGSSTSMASPRLTGPWLMRMTSSTSRLISTSTTARAEIAERRSAQRQPVARSQSRCVSHAMTSAVSRR